MTSLRQRLTTGLTEGAPLFPLLVLFGLNAVDELDRSAFNVLAPEIKDHFDLDLAGVFGLAALIEVVAILCGLPLAYWADRRSRLRLAVGGATLWGGFSLLTGLAPSVAVLALARAGAGMGRSVVTPTHFSLLADYYPGSIRPKIYGVHRSANSVGQFVGPLVAGLLAYWLGWRAPFLVFIVPTTIFLLLALRLTDPARGGQERREMGAVDETIETEEPAPPFGEGCRLLWRIRTLRRVWCALPFAAVVVFVGFGALFSIFYDQEFGLNEAQRGFVSAFTEPAQILGLLLGIPVANRLLKRNPALVLRFCALVGLVLAGFMTLLAITPYLAVVVGMHMLIAGVGALLAPAVLSILSLAMPPRARSLGFALTGVSLLPGLVLFPIIGALADAWGVRAALLLEVPLLAAAGLVFASAGSFVNDDIGRARSAALARSEALAARRRGEGKLLVVRGLDVAYDNVQVLFGVDFEVGEGEIVALLGVNGAGKSTLLRAISGVVPPRAGAVVFDGRDLAGAAPHEITALGIGHVPGGRGVFPGLTVAENLRVAGWTSRRRPAELARAIDEAVAHFPVLRQRWSQPAGNLSGGEQQMLTLAQAFVSRPKLLLIDELSLGLAPVVVSRLLDVVRAIREQGTAVVLVEQSVDVALRVAETAYFMEKGEIRFQGPAQELTERPDLLRAVFLGRASAAALAAASSGTGGGAGPPGEPVLSVEGLGKRFGAVTAVEGVSFDLAKGQILGVIGPNGAGKTTLFDLVSGFTEPDSGVVRLDGADVTDLSPDARARLGLGRSFQDARLFPSLTVIEAVSLSLERRLEVRDPVAAAIGLRAVARAESWVARRAAEIIDLMGLANFADLFVSELSTGTRRLVDLACALAHEPTALLLDEPSSGIAQRETEALAPVLRRIRDATGAGVLLIEHDLPLVTSVADEMLALHLGRVVVRGRPEEVVAHPQVAAAYLGSAEE
jgi:ABC-type branched-subunit amino acid transport system ATPase component/MFS family permease